MRGAPRLRAEADGARGRNFFASALALAVSSRAGSVFTFARSSLVRGYQGSARPKRGVTPPPRDRRVGRLRRRFDLTAFTPESPFRSLTRLLQRPIPHLARRRLV